MILFYLAAVLSRFVMISPKTDAGHVLAFKNRNHARKFVVTDRTRLESSVYSAIPLVVKRSDNMFELYFNGNKMCLEDGSLDACPQGDNLHGRWEMPETGGYTMLKNGALCIHVNRFAVFMAKCNDSEPKQLFTVKGIDSNVTISPAQDQVTREGGSTVRGRLATERIFRKASTAAPSPTPYV